MTFRWRPDKSVRKETRRLIRRQIDSVAEKLRKVGDDPDGAIHSVRKRLKQVRALLRLVRAGLGKKLYRYENVRFRDIARPLTEIRDAKVVADALDDLISQEGNHVVPVEFDELRAALKGRLDTIRDRMLNESDVVNSTLDALEFERRRLRDWDFDGKGWSVMGRGLARVHAAGAAALQTAETDPTVENLHEWRKQAKYLWTQFELLRSIHRKEMTRLADDTHRLTQLLGDDHDLAMLERTCDEEVASGIQASALTPLVALSSRRRSQLQQQAFSLGHELYDLSSEELAARLKRWWKGWRSKSMAR